MPSSYIFRKLLYTIFILLFYWQILIAFSRWFSGFKAGYWASWVKTAFSTFSFLSNFLISCCALSDFTYQIIAFFLAPLNLYHAAIVLNRRHSFSSVYWLHIGASCDIAFLFSVIYISFVKSTDYVTVFHGTWKQLCGRAFFPLSVCLQKESEEKCVQQAYMFYRLSNKIRDTKNRFSTFISIRIILISGEVTV